MSKFNTDPFVPIQFVQSMIRAASMCGVQVDQAINDRLCDMEDVAGIHLSKIIQFSESLLKSSRFGTVLPILHAMDFDPIPDVLSMASVAPDLSTELKEFMAVGPAKMLGVELYYSREPESDYLVCETRGFESNQSQFIAELIFCTSLRGLPKQFELVEAFHQVEFQFSSTRDSKEYTDYFGCPVLFNQENDRICFKKGIIDQPISSYSPYLFESAKTKLKKFSDQLLVKQEFGIQVSSVIEKVLEESVCLDSFASSSLSKECVSADAISKMLNVSPRSLHRKLSEANLSFAGIKYQTLINFSKRLFSAGVEDISQVAYILGFGDRTSFSKVFKKYEGLSPAEYRRHLKIYGS